eukprot:4646679-Amphidinium_carterae.1
MVPLPKRSNGNHPHKLSPNCLCQVILFLWGEADVDVGVGSGEMVAEMGPRRARHYLDSVLEAGTRSQNCVQDLS